MLSGWDNDHLELGGIFLARGPAFKVEHVIPTMEIVDVYQVSQFFFTFSIHIVSVGDEHPRSRR